MLVVCDCGLTAVQLAMQLFQHLLEALGSKMKDNFGTLFVIFDKGLRDDSLPVRVAAMRAIGELVQWLDTDEEAVRAVPR